MGESVMDVDWALEDIFFFILKYGKDHKIICDRKISWTTKQTPMERSPQG